MKAIRALLQFTTILPLGKPADFDRFARNSWLYPLAGYVTGGLAALPALIAWLAGFENSLIIAGITIALVIFITGANHFDGLLDFGDGLMAHGSREKRITAMTDRTTGAGALAMGILVVILSFAGLASLPVWMIGIAVLTAEVCGKMVMGLFSALGRPFHDGIQKYIYDHSKRWFVIPTILLALPLLLLPQRLMVAIAIVGALVVFGVLILIAKKLFGGVNGDVTGAGNELTRMVVILIFGILMTA